MGKSERSLAVVKNMSPIAFHMGHALGRLAATYPRLHDAVLEVVQNGIDAGAKIIKVVIDVPRRVIVITDDGDGASLSKVERSLKSIAHSIKPAGKLGRFGLGLISPIGKCAAFTFLSCPKNDEQLFRRWTFETKELERQAKFSGIPFETVPTIRFSRTKRGKVDGIMYVPWRTKVTMENFSADTLVSRIDATSLADAIRVKYGVTMRRNETTVEINFIEEDGVERKTEVRAKDFQGTALPELTLRDEHGGQTIFRLLIAPLTGKGRRGNIHFGEIGDDHRLSTKQFVFSTVDLLNAEVASALRGGIFEGEILSENARLLPSRRGFEKNEALLGLCLSIEKWFDTVGYKHVESILEESRERRHQDLGIRSLRVIEDLVRNNPDLERLIERIKFGTVGSGHVDPDDPRGETEHRSKSTQGGTGKKRAEGDENDRERSNPEREKLGHHPGTVMGPEGHHRTFVKDASLGLTFSYEDLPGNRDVYEFDVTTGTLRFNRRHELFVRCDKSDTALMRFQEEVATTALSYELLPEDWLAASGQSIKIFIEEKLKMTVHVILNGDMVSGRRGGPAKRS